MCPNYFLPLNLFSAKKMHIAQNQAEMYFKSNIH